MRPRTWSCAAPSQGAHCRGLRGRWLPAGAPESGWKERGSGLDFSTTHTHTLTPDPCPRGGAAAETGQAELSA